MAFRKGDIISVVDQNVAGTSGWWMCSLYGRQGLAPANRLQLLPQSGATTGSLSQGTEKPKVVDRQSGDNPQNIYQIPNVPRPSNSPAYERMDMIYKVPSTPLSASKKVSVWVPVRWGQVYAVPPALSQDPSYDIPVPSWIYDVPMAPEKSGPTPGSYDTMPSKAVSGLLYDTLPTHAWPMQSCSSTPLVYDIPKPSLSTQHSLDIPSPPKDLVYAVPPQENPSTRSLADPRSDHIPLECRGDSGGAYEHTRVRLQRIRKVLAPTTLRDRLGNGDSLLQEDDEKGRATHLSAADNQRISTASSSSTSSCDSLALSSSSPEPLREVTLSQEEASRRLLELQEAVCRAVPRLMEFVSSRWRSKEHLEKHLEEIKDAAEGIACSVTCFLNFALDVKGNARRLTDANLQTRLHKQLSIVEDSGVILQQTVSALNMAGWPLNTLSQDPGQVQTPDQLERFVMVARTVPEDVKRLVSILNANSKLLFRAPQKEPELPNTTGQPEIKKSPDGKQKHIKKYNDLTLDFPLPQTKTDFEKQQKEMQMEPKENITPSCKKPQVSISHQQNVFFFLEKKQRCSWGTYSHSLSSIHFSALQGDERRHSSGANIGTEEPRRSEHCRLYFGALQKAIGAFVTSLQDGKPPETFISHSKLVIMVGQRLVDTLCKEAHSGGSSQSLLCKSNHLCALLKQLAVATKKAALHFPDVQALHEAQEFAKELAQRAQHFRTSLDL
uniref:Cas scaffold protein family member 4 n=1 Tax=Myripristis murdjan TaxID=586833 RepID=A0A667ZX53_9TELE